MTAMVAPDKLHVGVAGWSYPDWDGYVYPPRLRDKLTYVAQYVDLVEINSTFYRPPDVRTVAAWVERTAARPGFAFTAKLHQDVTHGGIIAPEMARAFGEGLAPARDAGRLLHLLAQFRYDFADTPATREHLRRLREAFVDVAPTLTLELRHNTWQSPDALAFLAGLRVSVANLDYPMARDSFNLTVSPIGEHAYFRLHGRNAKAWFSKAGRDETYNYLYSGKELDEIAARAAKIGGLSKSLTLVANNHYRGKEMVTALQLKAMLGGEPVDVPPLLAGHYPELARIARSA